VIEMGNQQHLSEDNVILRVKNLKISFYTEEGEVKALENVGFECRKGEVLGLVGETGSGKSVSAYAVMGLIPSPPGKILEGEIEFMGQNLLKLAPKGMRKIRGQFLTMIFQEPMTSLNPVFTVEEQMLDILLEHNPYTKANGRLIALDSLKKVRMQDPEMILKKYPHELSGGMRQRVMIAMALACNPRLLIADEPTTALDVTIQAQILALLKEMQAQMNLSILLITHNLGVVAQNCDRIAVMYAGSIVEIGSATEIFAKASHPYTQGLLKAIPSMEERNESLNVIPGSVPNLIYPPSGCRFHPRCDRFVSGLCDLQPPSLTPIGQNPEHQAACYHPYGNDEEKESAS